MPMKDDTTPGISLQEDADVEANARAGCDRNLSFTDQLVTENEFMPPHGGRELSRYTTQVA